MTVHPFDVPGAPEDGSASPGRRLREARTAGRLSQDDVALRLRLDRRVIDALERDDYSGLPEPTFVRGYLRGYARLLGLPPGPIVEAYDRQGHTPPGLVPDIASRTQIRSTDMPVRLATYAIVAVLITLGVLWWRYDRVPEPVPLDQAGQGVPTSVVATIAGPATADSAPARASGPALPAPGPGVAATAAVAPPTPPAASANAAAASSAPAPTPAAAAALPARAGTAQAPASGTPLVAAAPAGTEPAPAAAGATATAAAPPPAAAAPAGQAPPPPATPGGPGQLVLRLKHDSWVEVYERGGKRLYFNHAKGGQTLALSGTPPFRVILGYAREAQVEYNGEPFDASRHTSRDIARFSVGG